MVLATTALVTAVATICPGGLEIRFVRGRSFDCPIPPTDL